VLVYIGDARALRQSAAQWAARVLETRQRGALGMSLQSATPLPECLQLLDGEIARVGERRVQHGRGVAVAQEEVVPLLPVGIGRIVTENSEVEGGKDLCHS